MADSQTGDRLSIAVVTAVAAREHVDPTDLEVPLQERIDPDALDLLLDGTRGSVTFEYHGYLVTVDSDGDVDLTDISRS